MDIERERLKVLQEKVRVAEENLRKALKKKWPGGTEIDCVLKHGQINPTTMTVIGHDTDGCVRAEMPSNRSMGGRFVKRVHYEDILRP